MKSMVPGLSLLDRMLSDAEIQSIHDLINRQPDTHWVHCDKILAERGVGNQSANYDLLFDRVLTEEERIFLRQFAPKFPDAVLQTQVINRYPVGGFLCDHTDRQGAIYNTIIPLQSNGDGVRWYSKKENGAGYDPHFLEDVAGRTTVLSDAFIIHGVPPVKQLRHVLISIFVRPEDAGWNPYEDMYQNLPSAT